MYEEVDAAAAAIGAAATALLALDWWNGSRTILAAGDVSGAVFGLTMQSLAAEIYRALLESVASGGCRIMDNFEEYGLPLDHFPRKTFGRAAGETKRPRL
jgi:L-ribulokinase